MTNYTNHNNLPIIDFDYTKKKLDDLDFEINNLTLKDIESDKKYKSKLKKISESFFAKEVSFTNPKIIENYQIEKELPASYELPIPHKGKIFIVTVGIKYSGSKELFEYRPKDYSHGMSSPNIFQPDNDEILIEIESKSLDKSKILNDFNQELSMTKQFIEQNNKFVKDWNIKYANIIEGKLRQYREDLINLYK